MELWIMSCSTASIPLQRLNILANSRLVRSLLPHLQDATLPRSLTVENDPDTYFLPPCKSIATELLPVASRLHHFSAPDGWQPSTEFEQLIGAMSDLRHLELGYTLDSTSTQDTPSHTLLAANSLGQLTSLRELTLRDIGEAQSMIYLLATLNDLLSTPPPSLKRIQLDLSFTTSWPEGARAELESKAEAAGVWLVFVV
ncbi:hypothetical protein BCR35DRAFT_331462 [Leucosporidium creatinivorum]|uniref:F-box domain-containing protein n=1 Tax=Leucosporidium creatinivorum TaxID=106004 RepID=A0A1Y2FEM5_9BASI|nr:hypothetical protein BCR35DRAFT_331462 [Leucosporidium creatinivorum]